MGGGTWTDLKRLSKSAKNGSGKVSSNLKGLTWLDLKICQLKLSSNMTWKSLSLRRRQGVNKQSPILNYWKCEIGRVATKLNLQYSTIVPGTVATRHICLINIMIIDQGREITHTKFIVHLRFECNRADFRLVSSTAQVKADIQRKVSL